MAFCNKYMWDYVSTVPLARTYAKINSGTCETHGMTKVQDKTECELASASLDLILIDIDDTSALDIERALLDFIPNGCTYTSTPLNNIHVLNWNSADGSDSLVHCGTKLGPLTFECICRVDCK